MKPRIASEQFVPSLDSINRPGRQPGIYVNLDRDVLDRLVSCAKEKEVEIGIPVEPATLASYLIAQGLSGLNAHADSKRDKPPVSDEPVFGTPAYADGRGPSSLGCYYPMPNDIKAKRRMSVMTDEELQQYQARRMK